MKEEKKKNIILAKGEFTGHVHELKVDIKDAFTKVVEDLNNKLNYLVKGSTATLTHQEHKPILMAEGEAERRFLVEVDPFTNELRQVMD